MEKLYRLEKTKEKWQLNTMWYSTLDSGSKKKKKSSGETDT